VKNCGNSSALRIFSCTANACYTQAEQFQPVPHHTPSPSLWCQLVWYYHSNGDNPHGSLAPSAGSRHNYHRWEELQMCAHLPSPFRPGLAPGRLPARTDTTIVFNRWIFTSRVRSKVLVCEHNPLTRINGTLLTGEPAGWNVQGTPNAGRTPPSTRYMMTRLRNHSKWTIQSHPRVHRAGCQLQPYPPYPSKRLRRAYPPNSQPTVERIN